tara:strand:+ start:118 stop:792 length:675 start_codon:yes stop_codon:yes gene_type:complete
MDVLLLVAGTNEPSNSEMLADAFSQGMSQDHTMHVHKRKLKDLNIHHFTIDYYEPQCQMEEDFCEFQELLQKASGLVIATPVWNFGVPAHLKNLIDRLGSFALAEDRSTGTLKGLPFYLIFIGGAPAPAWKGMMQKTSSHLPESLKYFDASYVGHHFEGRCTKGRGKFGLVVDERPESLSEVRKKGHGFAKVVEEYHRTGKAPISKRAQSTIMRWGEALLKKVS